jgi:outer membrane protein insertion porin family
MLPGKPFNYNRLHYTILAGFCIGLFASCSVVPRHYPRKTPFVYEYNINVEGNYSSEEKARLEAGLKNQLDDSIRVRTSNKFLYKGINRPVLDKPPVYESINADKSVVFMRNLLNSLGYFRDSITYDTTMRIVDEDQYRTTVNFRINPGKVTRLDSIWYTIKKPELDSINKAHLNASLLKKGEPFAKSTISVELDRMVDLYRNNGYMRFTREELIGVWDTLNPAIFNPTLDPFEQIALLDSIRKSRENPKANLEMRLRPGLDSSKLKKFFIGNITVYPDFAVDTTGIILHDAVADGIKVSYNRKLFKPRIFPQNIYFRRGDIYSQRRYFKTINRFNAMGAWRLVNIEQFPRLDQDTADFVIKLIPAKKYSFTANLETSRNQSAFSGNLFGIAVNFALQNRNFAKAANQTVTNIRFNVETGRDTVADVKFIQTRQLILGHTIYFPRVLPNFGFIPARIRDNFRTVFSANVGTTERRGLYNLNTVNGSWGYEYQSTKRTITVRIPNIEYSSLKSKPKLDEIFLNNPSLRNIFTDGFISSIIGAMTVNGGKKNNTNIIRLNMEASGILTGLIRNKFLDTNLYRFVKVDFDYTNKYTFNKKALVLRLFTAVGYELSSTVNPEKKNSLPFFRQYFAGGPNSMRAWALRKLGPGSVIKEFGTSGSPDRYGDIQLEANIEYRFPLFVVSGVKVNGALFTDIGNVWLMKKAAGDPAEVFKFSRLVKDLAVGVGGGLRVDLDFFVIRMDYSYKAKDPSPAPADAAGQNKWFYGTQLFSGQFQLGISYPFIQ